MYLEKYIFVISMATENHNSLNCGGLKQKMLNYFKMQFFSECVCVC